MDEENFKMDFSLFKKKGNSKTFSGWLIQQMKKARDNEKPEIVQMLNFIYQKYRGFQESEKVKLESWKGKSSFRVIEHPEKFIIITFQRTEKNSEPKEVRTEITRQEANEVLLSIQKLNIGDPIPTSKIAEMTYNKNWKSVFSDRETHIKLTKILDLLEYKKIIRYSRAGFSELLDNKNLIL